MKQKIKIIKHHNHFLLLRNLAALCIVFTHSFYLSGHGKQELLMLVTNGRCDFSFIGLSIFFSISGYLIAKSALTSSSYKNYLWKRFLRIQPLLIVVTLLTILIGAFFTSLSATAYFTHIETYTYLRNIMPVFGVQFHLPQVFTHNILEPGVNGSLWTLVVEERLYLLMLLLFLFKPYHKKIMIGLIVGCNVRYGIAYFLGKPNGYISLPSSTIFYTTLFLNAALFYVANINFAKYANRFFAIGMLILLVCNVMPIAKCIMVLALPFTIVSAAHVKFKQIPYFQFADYTYGIYIISFPIQQILVRKNIAISNPYLFFLTTMVIVLPMAVVSWHFFEKKVLIYKHWVK